MTEPIIIRLSDYFVPREYQKPMVRAFRDGCKRIVSCQARRSGKDICGLSLLVEAAIKTVGIYWYIWPNAEQGRKHAWNGKLLDGRDLLSLIPEKVIKKKNISDMSITLVNDSIIQIIGSEKVSTLRGGNPVGIIMTEFAFFSNKDALEVVLPMLNANDGWLIVLSTPDGHNQFYTLLEIAKDNPDIWFSQVLNIEVTQHISIEKINRDIEMGIMSWEKAQREYWCSFDVGFAGSIYGGAIDRLRAQGQITNVPYESAHPVHTAWDIGRDTTAIIFFQVVGMTVRIIDYYERKNEGLEHYVYYVKNKEYIYGEHFFPHDGKVIEWGGPQYTRQFKAQQLGLDVSIVKRVRLEDGIEWTRSQMAKIWIDEKNCARLLSCLEHYHYERNEKLDVNAKLPLHDWSSHGASAMMYLALSIDKTKTGMTEQQAESIRREAIYGSQNNLHPIFMERRAPIV